MRKLRVALGLLLSLFTALTSAQSVATISSAVEPPPPVHPATVAQIKEYWSLNHAMILAHDVMRKTADVMQLTAAPYMPKSFWDDLRDTFNRFDLETPFIAAYQRYLSEEDMTQTLAFYHSPAGQHLLASQPLIVSMSQDEIKKAAGELGAQVYERHRVEIEAAKAKYESNRQ